MTNKQEMMIEFTAQDMVIYLMEDFGLNLGKALDIVYGSDTFKLLEDVETALYLEESPYTYALLKKEPDFTTRVKGE